MNLNGSQVNTSNRKEDLWEDKFEWLSKNQKCTNVAKSSSIIYENIKTLWLIGDWMIRYHPPISQAFFATQVAILRFSPYYLCY